MIEYTIGLFYALLGAAIAMGMGGISAGFGVMASGVPGVGVVTEDPRKFGPVMVLDAIPQTQGIYGFLCAFMIFLGTGILGTIQPISEGLGLAALAAGIVVGLTNITAIPQGMICGAGMIAIAKKPEVLGQSIVLAVMAETFAIFGLLCAILVFVGIGFI
jgi:V/A-type H+-transporting ATPase subunit K